MIIEWKVKEEGRQIDDVSIGRNSESLGDFSRDENGFIAFPQKTVVIIVVFVVIPLSVSESEKGERAIAPATDALVRKDLRLNPKTSPGSAGVVDFVVVCFMSNASVFGAVTTKQVCVGRLLLDAHFCTASLHGSRCSITVARPRRILGGFLAS